MGKSRINERDDVHDGRWENKDDGQDDDTDQCDGECPLGLLPLGLVFTVERFHLLLNLAGRLKFLNEVCIYNRQYD